MTANNLVMLEYRRILNTYLQKSKIMVIISINHILNFFFVPNSRNFGVIPIESYGKRVHEYYTQFKGLEFMSWSINKKKILNTTTYNFMENPARCYCLKKFRLKKRKKVSIEADCKFLDCFYMFQSGKNLKILILLGNDNLYCTTILPNMINKEINKIIRNKFLLRKGLCKFEKFFSFISKLKKNFDREKILFIFIKLILRIFN